MDKKLCKEIHLGANVFRCLRCGEVICDDCKEPSDHTCRERVSFLLAQGMHRKAESNG